MTVSAIGYQLSFLNFVFVESGSCTRFFLSIICSAIVWNMKPKKQYPISLNVWTVDTREEIYWKIFRKSISFVFYRTFSHRNCCHRIPPEFHPSDSLLSTSVCVQRAHNSHRRQQKGWKFVNVKMLWNASRTRTDWALIRFQQCVQIICKPKNWMQENINA